MPHQPNKKNKPAPKKGVMKHKKLSGTKRSNPKKKRGVMKGRKKGEY